VSAELVPAAILSGGLATRLRPLTECRPKALIDINGEPFVAHQLRLLRSRGITRVVLCVGYLGEQIRDAIGSGDAFSLNLLYSFDGPNLLGTAGALRKALPLLGSAFFVLYGDSYLECDYAAVQRAFQTAKKPGLMTVYRNEDQWDASNVEFSGGQIHAYDKQVRTPAMKHIDYGLGVLSSAAVASVPAGQTFDLAELYRELLVRGELAAYEVTQRFFEVGSLTGMEELRRHLAKNRTAKHAKSAKT
jgi:NDP-sugar pyrophosphorylase family protein